MLHCLRGSSRISSLNSRHCLSTVSATTASVEETCIRLSQYVRLSGISSRREAERLIRSGRVKINDQVATYGGTALTQAELVTVTIDEIRISVPQSKILKALEIGAEATSSRKKGAPTPPTSHAHLYSAPPRLWIYNKVREQVCSLEAETDGKGRPTVGQFVFPQLGMAAPSAAGLSSGDSPAANKTKSMGIAGYKPPLSSTSPLKLVERLDYQTEGVCLLTDSGDFARWLGSEEAALKRTYRVRVHGHVTQEKLDGLKRGVVYNSAGPPGKSDGERGGEKGARATIATEGATKKSLPITATIDSARAAGSNSWLTLTTTHSNRHKNLQSAFARLYLRPVRVICTSFGPFSLLDSAGTGASEAEGKLPSGGVVEAKVPVSVMADFLARKR